MSNFYDLIRYTIDAPCYVSNTGNFPKSNLIGIITKNLELRTIRHRSKSVFYSQPSSLFLPSTLFSATLRSAMWDLSQQNILSFLTI